MELPSSEGEVVQAVLIMVKAFVASLVPTLHFKVQAVSSVKVFFATVSVDAFKVDDNGLAVKGETVQAYVAGVTFVLHLKVISAHLSVAVEVYSILTHNPTPVIYIYYYLITAGVPAV